MVSLKLTVKNVTTDSFTLYSGVDLYDFYVTRGDGTVVWNCWYQNIRIAILLHIEFEPGETKEYEREFVWEGLDNDGSPLSPGTYFMHGFFKASLTDGRHREEIETGRQKLIIE